MERVSAASRGTKRSSWWLLSSAIAGVGSVEADRLRVCWVRRRSLGARGQDVL